MAAHCDYDHIPYIPENEVNDEFINYPLVKGWKCHHTVHTVTGKEMCDNPAVLVKVTRANLPYTTCKQHMNSNFTG
jgi:hypothetical protein